MGCTCSSTKEDDKNSNERRASSIKDGVIDNNNGKTYDNKVGTVKIKDNKISTDNNKNHEINNPYNKDNDRLVINSSNKNNQDTNIGGIYLNNKEKDKDKNKNCSSLNTNIYNDKVETNRINNLSNNNTNTNTNGVNSNQNQKQRPISKKNNKIKEHSSTVVVSNSNINNRHNNNRNNFEEINDFIVHNRQPNYEPFLQSKLDPNFNMKETNTYIGTGIKKMKGYICEIDPQELEKKKQDFWSSRFEGNKEAWELLKMLCSGEFSNEDLNGILESLELKTYAGCINIVYDPQGNLYEIPNYCIHEPLEWNIEKLKKNKPIEKMVLICVRHVTTNLNLKVSNHIQCVQLKMFVIEDPVFKDQKIKLPNLRLFYNGKELKDNDYLYMFGIEDNSIVMMNIRPDD